MSAFIVNEKHILTLAYHYEKMVKQAAIDNISEIYDTARVLWKENIKSVNYRYNEKSRVAKFTDVEPVYNISMPALYKLIRCWEYQTCEHPNCTKSKAWRMMEQLQLMILSDIMTGHHPFAIEYENSSWGIY